MSKGKRSFATLFAAFFAFAFSACGLLDHGATTTSTASGTSTTVALSGSAADSLSSAKPFFDRLAGTSTLAGGTVEVINAAGAVLATTTVADNGTYTVDVPPGKNYFIRVTKGNVSLKAFVPDVTASTTATVDPTSTAVVLIMGQSAGNGSLGDPGVDASYLAANDTAAMVSSIQASSDLSALATSIADDITAHADYSASSSTATVGAGSSSAVAQAATISTGLGLAVAGSQGAWVSAIAAGRSHTLALESDGTVWAWGNNFSGQLGDGTTTDRTTPVQVSGLTGVTAIGAGGSHTVALKGDGTVWAWGGNGDGQLGDGTTTDRTTPVQVSGLTGVTAIAAGDYHTVALKGDGTVWAWGDNTYGQLGDGTTTDRTTPVQVSGLTGVTAIAAGYKHTVALKGDGTVWAWGGNTYGQLGDGTTSDHTTPVQVSTLTGVTAIAAGYEHTVALKGDGTVWAWGQNIYAQLGDGTTTDRTTPVQVSGLTGVTAIAAGNTHTVALKGDGTVWAWGYNYFGQLGDGTTTQRTTPVQVSTLTGVTAIAAGFTHSVALKGDGTVWTWGNNGVGQLGDGTNTQRTTPVQVLGFAAKPATITAIAAGFYHALALKGDGTVWAWGNNNLGQLGDGTTTKKTAPVQVSGLTGATAIAAGSNHALALKGDGTVWAWGYNSYGQLGDGTTTNSATPVKVSGLTGVTAIDASPIHTVALKSDGTVWAWGHNVVGQLGDGSAIDRATPVQVKGSGGTGFLTGVTAIAAGNDHTVALKGDGTVWSWGFYLSGQLGGGTTSSGETLVQASGLTGVTAIDAGAQHTVALKSDGTVWAWGDNTYGQLGDGTTKKRSTPVQVSGLTGVTAIATGGVYSVALKGDGTVWAWGGNVAGQLGDGTTTDRTTPVQVSGLTGVTAISAKGALTMALKGDGTVWAWGNNKSGQLGDGTTTNSATPVQVSGLSIGTPTGVTATKGIGEVTISWTAVTGATSYTVYYSSTAGVTTLSSTKSAGITGTSTTITGLTNGVTYYFIVTAVSDFGEGVKSAQVYAKPGSSGPAAPTGVGATAGNGQVTVNWSAVTGATSYTVYYGFSQAVTTSSPYSSTGNTGASATITGLTNGKTYYFIVTALDANGESAASSVVSATPRNIPDTPAGVGATAGNGQVTVSWTAATNAATYTVYYGTAAGVTTAATTKSTGNTGTSATITGLTNGTPYYFIVTAVSADSVESAASSEVSATPVSPAPTSAPAGVSVTGGLKQATVSWTAVTGAATYNVYYGTATGVTTAATTKSTGNTGTSATITGLTRGTTYYFIVTAANGGGEGPASSEVNVTLTYETVSVAAAGASAAVLKSDGSVWGWGNNTFYQLGHASNTNGDTVHANLPTDYYNVTPSAVSGLAGVKALAIGVGHTVAVKTDGTVWAWGLNSTGELGHALNSNGDVAVTIILNDYVNPTPVQVAGLTNIVAVSAGTSHTLALKSDGTVWAWGSNATGELGHQPGLSGDAIPAGLAINANATPVQVAGLANIVAIAAGATHNLAVDNSGNVWAWGDNSGSQLGHLTGTAGDTVTGGLVYNFTPAQVAGIATVTSVAAGGVHSMALKADGTVWTWGNDTAGQLGIGTGPGMGTDAPTQVVGVGGTGLLTGVASIKSGAFYSVALKADGTAVAWGDNTYGQLGDGTTTSSNAPVTISAVSGIISLAAADNTTVALKSDGTVYAWGLNDYGMLGHAPNTNGDLVWAAASYYNTAAIQVNAGLAIPVNAPTGVAATGGGVTQAAVSWTASTGAVSYNVYYATTDNVNPLSGTKVTGATSGGNITGLTTGTRYYFVVTAVDASGNESAPSLAVTAVP